MAQLRVENLTVSFDGIAALSGVSLTVGNGQRVGLIGEAGAGKSLVALAIAGLVPAAAALTGTIGYDDRSIAGDAAAVAELRGRKIALLFEDAATTLDPLLTAGEHLREALCLGGVPEDQLGKNVEALLVEIGLPSARASALPGSA